MILWSHNDFLSRHAVGLPSFMAVWIHSCKRPNYDCCISQGSV